MRTSTIPTQMLAATIIDGPDGAHIKMADVPVPRPGNAQILIRVVAAGLNRADLRRTQAHFQTDGPVIAGLEASGVVEDVGADVTDFAPGDLVAAMAPSTYAQYALADDVSTLKLPAGFDLVTAAALPTWYMTAHNAVVTAGGLRRGDAVLITAARSGIGIAACQVARTLGASSVVGSTRSGGADPALTSLGWDAVIPAASGTLGKAALSALGEHGADVTIDMVGAGILGDLVEAAALGGRIVSVGRLGGFNDTIDLNTLALKRLSLIGVTFRTRGRDEKRAVRDAMVADLWPHLQSGAITPVIDSTFPLQEAAEAQAHMAANKHFGKVLLRVADP